MLLMDQLVYLDLALGQLLISVSSFLKTLNKAVILGASPQSFYEQNYIYVVTAEKCARKSQKLIMKSLNYSTLYFHFVF